MCSQRNLLPLHLLLHQAVLQFVGVNRRLYHKQHWGLFGTSAGFVVLTDFTGLTAFAVLTVFVDLTGFAAFVVLTVFARFNRFCCLLRRLNSFSSLFFSHFDLLSYFFGVRKNTNQYTPATNTIPPNKFPRTTGI